MTKKKTTPPGPIAAARAALAELLGQLGHTVHTAPPATFAPPCLAVMDASPALVAGPSAGTATAHFEVVALAEPSADPDVAAARVDALADAAFLLLHDSATVAGAEVHELGTYTFADGQPYAGARLSCSITLTLKED